MYPVDSFLCLDADQSPLWVNRDELVYLGYADEMEAYAAMSEETRQARLTAAKEKSISESGEYLEPEEMSSRDIQSAVRIILPGELAKHAVSEGTKAVTKFCSINDETEPHHFSKAAGLQFPVARTGYDASRFSSCSLSTGAAVYLTAVCEYAYRTPMSLRVFISRSSRVHLTFISCSSHVHLTFISRSSHVHHVHLTFITFISCHLTFTSHAWDHARPYHVALDDHLADL
jgi:hypothetical protein